MVLRPNRPQSRAEQLAARDSAQGEGFLREVDEALRQDETMALLRRYGKPLGIVVAAALVGLAGGLAWHEYQGRLTGAQGETFVRAIDAVEAHRPQTAQDTAAPLTKDGSAGYQAASRLLAAGLTADLGKSDAAAKDYAAIAADPHTPEAWRDLATLRDVAARFDQLLPAQVITRLTPLATAGNPWFGSASELVAMAELKQGHKDQAGQRFAAIARDHTVPDSLRQRAREMAGLLGVDAVDDALAASQTGGQ